MAVALAAVTGLLVAGLVERASSAAARYGVRRPVAVATRDLAAGHVVEPGDAVRRELPAALVPDGALRDPPVGRITAARVVTGEVLVGARLARAGIGATAALLPEGTRGVAVPTGDARPPVAVGDTVDLLATFDPGASGVPGGAGAGSGGAPSFAVARRALVVHVGDDAVTVAVPSADAPRVAFALAQGLVTVALSGDPPRR